MSDIIRSAYQRTWWAILLRGVFSLCIGAFILWRPLDSIATFALVIAFWSLFNGITQVVHGVALRQVFTRWWVLLVSGFVAIAFGIAALTVYPGLSLAFAVIWVTWWLFLVGGFAILLSVVERRHGLPWGWTLAFGVVNVIAAVYGLMSPPATLAAIMALIATFALVSGAVHVTAAFKLASAKAQLTDSLHGAAAR